MAGQRERGGGGIFRTRVGVRFFEADPAGVLFFARYFSKAHEVLEEFVPAAGIPWEEWFGRGKWIVPLRRVEAEYRRPLRPGKEVRAELRVEELGRSKVVFLVRFFAGEGEEEACLVRMTCVFVDKERMKPVSIPGPIRERLAEYLA